MVHYKDAYNLPVFNPIVKNYRYQYTEKLFKAQRILGHWPQEIVDSVENGLKNGLGNTEIVKKGLNEKDIGIRIKNIIWRKKKLQL